MERANHDGDFSSGSDLPRRALQVALLVLISGGVLWWLAARRIRRAARSAPCSAPPADAILVPGHRLAGAEVEAEYALRLQRAYLLWCEHPDQALLLSGCAGDADSPSEALAGLIRLFDLGLPAAAVVTLDEAARDTIGNLRNAAAALGNARDVVIVSNRYHLARCHWIAQRLGLHWQVCAAESRWHGGLYDQAAVAREALVLLGLAGWRGALHDPLSPPEHAPALQARTTVP